MALYCTFGRTQKALLLPSYILIKSVHKNVENRNVVLETNTLDNFTTQLLQKQSSKWEKIQAKSKEFSKYQENVTRPFARRNMEKNVWTDVIDKKDIRNILDFLRFCVENNTAPPKEVISPLTQCLAEGGKSEAIIQIKGLCEVYYPELLRLNANFDIYLAEALWNQGDLKKSLILFADLYEKSNTFQTQIKSILKYLFLNVIKSRGEAALLIIIKFCEDLHKRHKDLFLLCVVWQMCFLSEWFSDQNIAFELMEKNEVLRKVVLLRVPFLVVSALNNNQIDVVYRLLQFLIEHDLKTEYSSVLQSLFDYKSMLVLPF